MYMKQAEKHRQEEMEQLSIAVHLYAQVIQGIRMNESFSTV
jgi:hypothetical protein